MRVTVRPFPDAPPGRPAGAVHVWQARLDPAPVPDPVLEAALTADERDRRDRYRHPRARDQFVRSRGLLRLLLGLYLCCPPRAVPITYDPDGKPTLERRADVAPVEFNVSHTDGLAVIAVADHKVGVDVESVRPVPTADGLVDRFFAPAERDQYRVLPAELGATAFLHGWTCKEAVLKGIGCGARELDRCVIDLDPRRPARVVGPAPTAADWRVASWRPGDGYVAAVAVATGGILRLEWSG
jgi:4'-phosphopantetheinyl transferase